MRSSYRFLFFFRGSEALLVLPRLDVQGLGVVDLLLLVLDHHVEVGDHGVVVGDDALLLQVQAEAGRGVLQVLEGLVRVLDLLLQRHDGGSLQSPLRLVFSKLPLHLCIRLSHHLLHLAVADVEMILPVVATLCAIIGFRQLSILNNTESST